MGTIPRDKLKIMSLARTPLYRWSEVRETTDTANALLGGLRCDLSNSSLIAHLSWRNKRESAYWHVLTRLSAFHYNIYYWAGQKTSKILQFALTFQGP